MLLTVKEESFALAHYTLIGRILKYGSRVPTDYDKPDEPMSLDASVAIEVFNPWSPPIFSKCIYDSAEGLLSYRDEIVDGVHDNIVDKLGYTYHARFAGQMDGIDKEILRNPYTRRAQYITWNIDEDLGAEYPPCHQRGWFRVIDGKLDFHTTWRSRDVFKAWGSNVFGFAHLHKKKAEQWGYPIGRYIEWIDSAHIYGRDIESAKGLAGRPFYDWAWTLEEINESLPTTLVNMI